MALITSNASATTPKDQYIQGLQNNKDIPAGQTGSPWTVDPAPPTPSATGSTPPSTAGNNPPPTPLSTARASYLSSLDPSSDLTSAKTKYLDFLQSTDSGIAALEGQGRGIPLGLVRGQQEKLGKQAEITAKRLQGDVTLAQDNATLAQEKAKANLGFAQDDATLARTDAKDLQTEESKAVDFNLKNGVNSPYYYSGNLIINASTGKPEYKDNNGEMQRLSDGYKFSDAAPFLKELGINSFDQIQKNIGNQAVKFETVSIGTTKNPQHVRYGYDNNGNVVSAVDLATGKSILGNTKGGVAPVITPKSTTSTPKGSTTSGPKDTAASVKAWIYANKKANPDLPYYDLWGQLADELTKNKINPTNYDKIFWEELHPEGLEGYKKYHSDERST